MERWLEGAQGKDARERHLVVKGRNKGTRCKLGCDKYLMADQNTCSFQRLSYGK